MQLLIAKYGLAAHLALLAVVPVLLFPFCSARVVATVLLWLSLMAAVWALLEPSLRGGERMSEARRRVAKGIWRDPLFWLLLVIVALSGFRALNTGIRFSYDAEAAVWRVLDPSFPLLPGVVGDAGYLPFATAVALLVLVQACRHSLGRAARLFFLLLSSALAGLAALIDLTALHLGGFGGVDALVPSVDGIGCSFAGFVFAFYLIVGVVALVAVPERDWNRALVPAAVAICGTVAGVIVFSPLYLSVVLTVVGLLMLVYVLSFVGKTFHSVGVFKVMIVGLTAFLLGGLIVAMVLPPDALANRLSALLGLRLFPERFWEIRKVLSHIAFKSWVSHLWLGTGMSTFALDFRVGASAADWDLLPRGASALANGWWLLLAERGLVGFVFLVLPFGFLLFTYVRRLVGGVSEWGLPHPVYVIAPLVFALFIADGFLDCSQLRAEVLLATGSLAAVSAASFPVLKRGKNG